VEIDIGRAKGIAQPSSLHHNISQIPIKMDTAGDSFFIGKRISRGQHGKRRWRG